MDAGAPVAAWLSLSAAVLFQGFILAWLVVRAQGEAGRERRQPHEFMLGALDRVRGEAVRDVLSAETHREMARLELLSNEAAAMSMEEKVAEQIRLGFVGDDALARVLMSDSGMDPDDPDQVDQWNAIHLGSPN